MTSKGIIDWTTLIMGFVMIGLPGWFIISILIMLSPQYIETFKVMDENHIRIFMFLPMIPISIIAGIILKKFDMFKDQVTCPTCDGKGIIMGHEE